MRMLISYSDTEECISVTTKSNYTVEPLASVIKDITDYKLKVKYVDNKLHFYYSCNLSEWVLLYNTTINFSETKICLGLVSFMITMFGSTFDYFYLRNGCIRYPREGLYYYGIMNMDNIKTNQSTIIEVYDIDIEGDNLYRLQREAAYYGTDYSWTTYNFQISPIRSFIDFITVDSNTHIVPATGRNTVDIYSVTFDQYGNGVINKPVTFIDDDVVGFITTPVVYTDVFNGTGKANTAYTSGVDLRVVTINASVTQVD